MSESFGTPMNTHNQPIGPPLPRFTPRPRLVPTTLEGTHVTLNPLAIEHAAQLNAALGSPEHDYQWTYMMSAPLGNKLDDYTSYITAKLNDPAFAGFAITHNESNTFAGSCALIRHRPEHGSVEAGHIIIAPNHQRSPVLTNAVYLLAKHAFDNGYRRFEWKCDALNERSVRAAKRLGFRYEGTFRNDLVYKGRSRDTAWFSITDEEWQTISVAFEAWLAPSNFDSTGNVLTKLNAEQH